MLRKALLALIFAIGSSSAWAQNIQCPDRASGDSSNACANTRFVHNFASNLIIGTTAITGGSNGAPLYNNAGILGNGQIASLWSTFLGYNALTTRTVQAKLQEWFSINDYIGTTGCVPGDYTTSCDAALLKAIAEARNYTNPGGGLILGTSGTVFIPPGRGCYRFTTPPVMLSGVSLQGIGGEGSCMLFDNTDGPTYSYEAYYGQPQINGILLYGCHWNAGTSLCDPPTSARTAIKRPQVGADAGDSTVNRMLGLAIQNVLVWGFDTAIDITTVGNLWITNSQFQNINTCVKINGFSYSARFQGAQFSYGTGDGLGARGDCIVTAGYTYTTPAQTIGPESILFNNSDIFDFNNGIRLNLGNVAAITNSTIQTRVSGVRFKDWGLGLDITNNYILMTDAAIQAAIFCEGTVVDAGTRANQYVNIKNNVLQTTSAVGTNNGIQINEAGLFGCHDINVVNNRTVTGFTGRDLHVFGPNKITAEGNNFASAGAVASVEFTSAAGTLNFITRNTAAVSVIANAGDVTAGDVRKCDNVVAGVKEACTWVVTTNSTTANRLVLGGGAGVQPTALGAGTTTTVLHGNAGGAPTFGAVANADLTNSSTTVNGQTCTLGSTCTVVATASSALTFGTHLTSGGASYNGSVPITITSDATAVNTASTIMARDGSGQVAATTFTGALLGNSTTSTASATSTIVDDTTTNANMLLSWVTTNTGNLPLKVTSTKLTFNPSNGQLSTTRVSATTVDGFLLNGTISGGGNQVNNVIIGTSTPLAGFFTTLSATTSITSPLHIGGTTASSTLTLESTSGAGTTDAIIGLTASQVERFRVTTGGLFNIGPAITPDTLLTVNANTGASIAPGTGTPQIHAIAPNTTIGGVLTDTYGSQGVFIHRYAGGTRGSESAAAANTALFSFFSSAYDGTAYMNNAGMDMLTINAQTSTDHSSRIRFRTISTTASATLTERATIQQGLSVGDSTDRGVGTVSSTGGFWANGSAGITTTCTIAVGNVLTFTLGIITAKGGVAGCT